MGSSNSAFRDAIQQNLGPIVGLLDDPTVSEILVNGAHEIFVERKGKLERTPLQFADEDALRAAVT
jgi:pilus assembly protein CpaF